jgi:hypothetical protein
MSSLLTGLVWLNSGSTAVASSELQLPDPPYMVCICTDMHGGVEGACRDAGGLQACLICLHVAWTAPCNPALGLGKACLHACVPRLAVAGVGF